MLNLTIRSMITLTVAMTVLLTGTVASVQASGFGIFTQGATAMGQGNAVTANTSGPSTTYFNPALLTRLPGTQIEIGTTLIVPEREFTSATTGQATSTTDTVFFPSTIYASHRLTEKWAVGLGVFSPFGLATTWPDSWEGRFAATKSSLTTFTINPTLAWQPLTGVRVAAGLDILYMDTELNSRTMFPGAPFPSVEVPQQLKADGTTVSYNLGLAVDLAKGLTLGAAYREQYRVEISGDMTVGPVTADANTTVTLPRQLAAGLAYDTGNGLTIEAGVRWEDWSSYQDLQVKLGPPLDTTLSLQKNWSDTYTWNLGGKYRFNDQIAIMAGYVYGDNPVPNETFEPAIPDSNTHIFCLGTDLTFNRLWASVSYGLQLQEKRTSQSYPAGSYESMLHLVGMSVGYRF